MPTDEEIQARTQMQIDARQRRNEYAKKKPGPEDRQPYQPIQKNEDRKNYSVPPAASGTDAPTDTNVPLEQIYHEASQRAAEYERRKPDRTKYKYTPGPQIYPAMTDTGRIVDLSAPQVTVAGPVDQSRQAAARTQQRKEERKIIQQIKRTDPEGYTVFSSTLEETGSFPRAIKAYNKDLERRKDAYIKQTSQDQLLTQLEMSVYARESAAWNALQQRYEAAENELSNYKIKTGGKAFYDGEWHESTGYDIEAYLKDNKNNKKKATETLVDAGFSRADINDAAYYANLNLGQKIWQGLTPWDEKAGETVSVKGAAIMAGDIIVPGFYTARNWSNMSPGERAGQIAIDVVSLAPFAFVAARGARVVGTGARAARLAMAGKAVAREAMMQVRAPVDLIIHPIKTGKVTYAQIRNVVETFNAKKLPEFVSSISNGTVRIKLSELADPARALELRAKLMREAIKTGENIVFKFGDQTIELRRSPLMRELGGGAAHSTPMGGSFETGIKVAEKPGMPPSEQGIFFGHEPYPRFATTSAFGKKGTRPSINIYSRETAEKLMQDTGKIYKTKGGSIIEAELKADVGTNLPPMDQKLYTRIGPEGIYTEINIEGKGLSKSQIAKLKAENLAEVVKAPFTPPVKIKGKGPVSIADDITGLTPRQVDELARELRKAGYTDEARALVRAQQYSRAERSANFARVVRGRVAGRSLTSRNGVTVPVNSRLTTTPTDTKGRFRTIADETGRKPSTPMVAQRPGKPDEPRKPGEPEKVRKPGISPERKPRKPKEKRPPERPQDTERTTGDIPDEIRIDAIRTDTAGDEFPRITDTTPGSEARVTDPTGERGNVGGKIGDDNAKRKITSKSTDEEKRKYIQAADAAIAYRRGELNNRSVWHTWALHGNRWQRVIIMGDAPQGAEVSTGVRSAYKTIQRLGKGKLPPKGLFEDTGAVDTRIMPSDGAKPHISFHQDRGISRKAPRISPRMRKLR